MTARRTRIAALVVGAAATLAGTAASVARNGGEVTVARGSGPRGGSFRLAASEARPPCFRVVRRARAGGRRRSYDLRGCARGVPRDRALRSVSAYNCYLHELMVVGAAAPRVARVEVRLSRSRQREATLYPVPRRAALRGSLLLLLLRVKAPDVDDQHPKVVIAYDSSGREIGRQRFPSGSAQGFGCYAASAAAPTGARASRSGGRGAPAEANDGGAMSR